MTQGKEQRQDYTIVDLASLVEAGRPVPVGEGRALMVYGLPFAEMMSLFGGYLEYLDEMLDENATLMKTTDLVSRMMVEAPELMARTVCMATRQELNLENLGKCRQLAAGVQMLVVVEALGQTFPDGELMGKFWARIEDLVGRFSSQLALKLAVLRAPAE